MGTLGSILHVTNGDALAERLRAAAPDADVLVMREALHDGPLSPSPNEDVSAYVAMRAHHLASRHEADERTVRQELGDALQKISEHQGDIVLHVETEPCVDCATFTALLLETLHRAGRGVAGSETGVAIARGDGEPIGLTPADVAAGAGVWRLLVAGDAAGLTLTAADLEGQGGMGGYPELPGLLVRRAAGDVALEECKP